MQESGDFDEVQEATLTLKNQNAKEFTRQIDPMNLFDTSPIPMSFVGFASHETIRDLENDPKWVPIEKYASQGVLGPWERGSLGRVRFVEQGTDNITYASTVTVHATVILGQGYYGMTRISDLAIDMIHTPPGLLNDPLKQREAFGWKLALVFIRLNENMAVRIEHAVT